MHLSIIARTHDRSNLHGERYSGTAKDEVTYRCLYSLIQAINVLSRLHLDVEIELTAVDDHSKNPGLIKKIVAAAGCPTRVELLKEGETGNNTSLLRYFELGCKSPELVYLVEDDYLHCPSAIAEMVADFVTFSSNLGRLVALNPFDDPDNYLPDWLEPSRIVLGQKRHWRTNVHSLCTFMIHRQSLRDHWPLFEKLAREYAKVKGVTEDSLWGRLWAGEVPMFSPVPSLALHLQTARQLDPYINWREWWKRADYRKLP